VLRPFNLSTGVKAGCPSPHLLFSIYIDTVVRSLIAQLRGSGWMRGQQRPYQTPKPAPVRDHPPPLPLYADDIALMAQTSTP
jgi:hypothetical protein